MDAKTVKLNYLTLGEL